MKAASAKASLMDLSDEELREKVQLILSNITSGPVGRLSGGGAKLRASLRQFQGELDHRMLVRFSQEQNMRTREDGSLPTQMIERAVEDVSLPTQMIDRNWVLKRKRKQPSCRSRKYKKVCPSTSLEPPKCGDPLKKKLKTDIDTATCAQKIKGHDGYFFECVECDLGGNLLCCDSCPRTYHLDCLKPPLKCTPPGKWQCPLCCGDEVYIKASNSVNAKLRQAKIKNIFESSRISRLSANSDNLSPGCRSPDHQTHISTNKRKTPCPSFPSEEGQSTYPDAGTSCSIKSSSSCDDASMDVLLPAYNKNTKNNTPTCHRTKGPSKDMLSVQTLDPGDVSLTIKSSNKIRGKKVVLPSSQSSQKIKKKKHKSARRGKKVCSNFVKEKNASGTICGNTSQDFCKGTSDPSQNSKSTNPQTFVTEDEVKMPKASSLKQHESSSERLYSSSRLNEKGLDDTERTTKFYDNFLHGTQQVDRILGCRLHSTATSPGHSQPVPAYISTSAHSEQKPVEFMHETNPSASSLLEIMKKPLEANGVLEENSFKALGVKGKDSETSKEQCLGVRMCEVLEPLACEAKEKKNVEDLEKGMKEKSLEGQMGSMTSNIVVNDVMMDLVSPHTENVTCEFLVKWAGKSNIHNSWVLESHLKFLAKRKLENYKAKYGTSIINICEDRWCIPQRIIAIRSSGNAKEEALVKWCGLPYDECTWERLDEPIVEKFAHLIGEFKQFQSQCQAKDSGDAHIKAKNDAFDLLPLAEQPEVLQGGSLFPHQLEALNWLRKCWHRSKNVILADEMGLGKTVSACAFISSLNVEFKVKLPSLVLVPLSTMPNWMAEFAQWTPHVNVVEYHGGAKARSIIRQYEWHAVSPNSSRITKSYKFHVLLTTYEMVIADSSHLRGVPWEILVVDEGHRLKNSESKLFGLLNSFSFQHRILLTGTPLQNNIGEMYNLLNFLQPASFPSISAFEEKFKNLTTTEKVDELKKLVAPHMLRRLKKDTMQNIPPKTERIVPVELSSIQAEYYRAMLTKNYHILRNTGKGGAHQSLLNIVMQLRKVCNHPYLIPGTEPESGSVEFLKEMRIKASAKLTLLHSMLKILNEEGHRVLIFSQMTKLLDILEDYLSIEFGAEAFERVDGSVSVADRQAAITRFNQDRSRFVFLLSTRSCGLGINLATADTVIIYDSDFNPHADIQAMNRAHRIGQSSRLLVYRLVVRASVEERILQLAKKKLILDQLFVNKSDSQKEAEDILRWGTEELFSECVDPTANDPKEGSPSKTESVVDGDFKNRRKAGGLGDVYKDRRTDSSSKILWDENAIIRLLDRSNLQSATTESAEGDLDNDMLGSVKSHEWTDEQNEESGDNILLTDVAGDGSVRPFETKEDNLSSTADENEWDRFLRVRWERYQFEEEAALGRGKRLRKAISYRETFPSVQTETLSESGNEDEEPEPEYTPAGRALKEKYSKLRARQKERIAQRHKMELRISASSTPLPLSSYRRAENFEKGKTVEDTSEHAHSVNMDDTEIKAESDSIARPGRLSKLGFKRLYGNNLEGSDNYPGPLTSNPFPSDYDLQNVDHSHLPVLGLCAPNATQAESTSRKSRSSLKLPPTNGNFASTTGVPDFQQPQISGSGTSNGKERDTYTDASQLPRSSRDALHERLKSIIPDGYFPFNSHLPIFSQGRGSDPADPSGASFPSFQEKIALSKLAPDHLPPNIPLPCEMTPKPSHLDSLPSLSLGISMEAFKNPIPELPNFPVVPDFRHHSSVPLKMKSQLQDALPMLGLGHISSARSSLPENHKKVLDNIIMRTGSARNNFFKKKLKSVLWSEDELDNLWIGVRRHGRGNWEAMLRDHKLKFSKHRNPDDLSVRWAEEQLKIFDVPPTVAPKNSKPPKFPGISDGMMARALLGSNLTCFGTDPPKPHSHMSNMQLGCGDLMPPFPHIDQIKHFCSLPDGFPPISVWNPNKFRSAIPGEFCGPAENSGSSNIPMDLPFQHPFSCIKGSLGMDFPSNRDLWQNDEELRSKYNKLPNLLDRPLSSLCEPHNMHWAGESSSRMLFDHKQNLESCNSSMNKEAASTSSKVDKLPHWLREAVNVTTTKVPEVELPLTVSAIAQSVRLLYGEDEPTIPPFKPPGPPLCEPKDPRKALKKKRKLHKIRQEGHDTVRSRKYLDASASGLIPLDPTMSSAPEVTLDETNPISPCLKLNLNTPSSSIDLVKSPGTVLPSSSEILNLVSSSMSFGPCMTTVPQVSPSCQNCEVAPGKAFEASNAAQNNIDGELKWAGLKEKKPSTPVSSGEKLQEEEVFETEKEHSRKTHSNECRADSLRLEVNSSEHN